MAYPPNFPPNFGPPGPQGERGPPGKDAANGPFVQDAPTSAVWLERQDDAFVNLPCKVNTGICDTTFMEFLATNYRVPKSRNELRKIAKKTQASHLPCKWLYQVVCEGDVGTQSFIATSRMEEHPILPTPIMRIDLAYAEGNTADPNESFKYNAFRDQLMHVELFDFEVSFPQLSSYLANRYSVDLSKVQATLKYKLKRGRVELFLHLPPSDAIPSLRIVFKLGLAELPERSKVEPSVNPV